MERCRHRGLKHMCCIVLYCLLSFITIWVVIKCVCKRVTSSSSNVGLMSKKHKTVISAFVSDRPLSNPCRCTSLNWCCWLSSDAGYTNVFEARSLLHFILFQNAQYIESCRACPTTTADVPLVVWDFSLMWNRAAMINWLLCNKIMVQSHAAGQLDWVLWRYGNTLTVLI